MSNIDDSSVFNDEISFLSKKKSKLAELELEESRSMNSINFESINSDDIYCKEESSNELNEIESTFSFYDEQCGFIFID